MDSKSFHRVAEWANAKGRYDSKRKLWSMTELDDVGRPTGKVLIELSSADVEGMSTLELRKRLNPSLLQEGEVLAPLKTGGENSIAEAARIVSEAKPKAKKAKKPKAAKAVKKQPESKHADEPALVKVTFPSKRSPKRTAKDDEGKLWLPGIGISKWQTRQKLIARGNKSEATALNKNRTQYLTKAEAKDFARFIFDDEDKKILAKREQHSKRAVKYAEDARDAAEALLAAASKL